MLIFNHNSKIIPSLAEEQNLKFSI